MANFAPITDSRIEHLNNELPGVKKYRHRSVCTKCREYFCTSTIGFIRTIIILTMFCATAIYCGFGILYVWNKNNVTDSCNISHLWYYILISTIQSVFRGIYRCCIKYDKKITTAMCCFGCCLIIELILSVWGFIDFGIGGAIAAWLYNKIKK